MHVIVPSSWINLALFGSVVFAGDFDEKKFRGLQEIDFQPGPRLKSLQDYFASKIAQYESSQTEALNAEVQNLQKEVLQTIDILQAFKSRFYPMKDVYSGMGMGLYQEANVETGLIFDEYYGYHALFSGKRNQGVKKATVLTELNHAFVEEWTKVASDLDSFFTDKKSLTVEESEVFQVHVRRAIALSLQPEFKRQLYSRIELSGANQLKLSMDFLKYQAQLLLPVSKSGKGYAINKTGCLMWAFNMIVGLPAGAYLAQNTGQGYFAALGLISSHLMLSGIPSVVATLTAIPAGVEAAISYLKNHKSWRIEKDLLQKISEYQKMLRLSLFCERALLRDSIIQH